MKTSSSSPVSLLFLVMGTLISCSSTPSAPTLDLAGEIPRHYAAPFAHQAPLVDGQINDAAWRKAPWTANFVSRTGGSTPRFQTRAKMLWDRQNLYLGVWMVAPNLQSMDLEAGDYAACKILVSANLESEQTLTLRVEPGGDFLATGKCQVAVALSGTLDHPGDADRGWWVEAAIPWSTLSPQTDSIQTGTQLRINLLRQAWSWSPHFDRGNRDRSMWGVVTLSP